MTNNEQITANISNYKSGQELIAKKAIELYKECVKSRLKNTGTEVINLLNII